MTNVNLMSELEILTAALAVGWVKFSYYKKDGSHRIAIGTRNPELLERFVEHKAVKRDHYAESVFPYFDLTRGDFRCFLKGNFDRIELERLDTQDAVINAMTLAYALKDISIDQYSNVVEICRDLTDYGFVSAITESLGACPSNITDDNMELVDQITRSVECQVKQVFPLRFEQRAHTSERKKTRAELIAELMELRKRESEILEELLQ